MPNKAQCPRLGLDPETSAVHFTEMFLSQTSIKNNYL